MARTLCVWFPDWPLRRPDAPSGSPCQVVEDGAVTAADPLAREAGVRVGMNRRQAEALCPAVTTLIGDPGAEAVAFEPVILAIEGVVPRVEVVRPGLLFVPVAGAVRFYGGEQALVDRIVEEVGVKSGVHLGVADGPFGAQMAAARATDEPLLVDDTVAFLADLDVSVIGSDLVDTFRWLGITTLGDLSRLPREAIASRFGLSGLAAHRVASGEDRTINPRPLPVDASIEDRFDPPLADLERAAFAARSLSSRLLDHLMPRGGLPHLVEVEAVSAEGEVRTRTWRSQHPFSESDLAERIRWQLRAWVESGGVSGGIHRIRLAPGDLSDRGRQLRLDEDAASTDDANRALIRAQSLVGPDSVLRALPQGGRDPAERVSWYRWGEEPGTPQHDPAAPWPGAIPDPAPALAGRTSIMIEWDEGFPSRVRLGSRWEEVLSWTGPWRRTGRWWEGQPAADRYQVVTSAGAFLCEVDSSGAWVTGVYD